MNKKILSIIFSLFLVGVFSISCSSKEDPKGIEQFNGNTYVSAETFDASSAGYDANSYVWVSVKGGKLAMCPDANNATAPSSFDGFYMDVSGSGTDYRFSIASDSVIGTFKFASDGNTVIVS